MRKQPTSYDRAKKLKAMREFYSGINTLDFEGRPIVRKYLGKDLVWERGKARAGAKIVKLDS